MNKKLYPTYMKGLTAIFSVALASTLIGCQATKDEPQNTEITQNTENNQDSNYSEIEEYLQTQKEKDTQAEAAISIMLDGAEQLKESASESANSEAVQNELSNAMENFKVLSDFIFNSSQIDRLTFSQLTHQGKQTAKNALNSLDNTIDELVPNYKERFKDWFTDSAAKGLDALDSLKDKGSELWDEIQSKRKTK